MTARHILLATAAWGALRPECTLAWIPSRRITQQKIPILNAFLEDGGSRPLHGEERSPLQDEERPELGTEPKKDYTTGAGTLGDIMASRESADFSGLVTTEGGLLQASFGIQFPLDRMALTANGNLQRLFSSYYDSPVHVVVDQCDQTTEQTWNRVVHLTVHNQTFCTATSCITVHDETCRNLVESGKVGLGQLFRYLDKLPSFVLRDAGYSNGGGLWRVYELTCHELDCHIREDFLPDMWNVQAQEL